MKWSLDSIALRRGSHRPFSVACVVLAAILAVGPAWPSPVRAQGDDRDLAVEAGPARLCLLVVADTNDPQIGNSVRVDLDRIRDLFSLHVPENRLQTRVLSGRSVSRSNILGAIRSIGVRSGKDTLMLYFSGHGGYDTTNRDHAIKAGRDETYRTDLRQAIQARRPRLAVILTDTCSNYVSRPPRVGAPAPPGGLSPAFKSLFFDPQGLVDVSCTQPGEFAIGDDNGGYFTTALCEYLSLRASSALTWSQVVKSVNRNVKDANSDARQTAYALSALPAGGQSVGDDGGMDVGHPAPGSNVGSPGPGLHVGSAGPGSSGSGRGPRRVRFGAVVSPSARAQAQGGVEVTQVVPGSPATAMRSVDDGQIRRLVAGMHAITHINGQPIHSYQEFSRAIADSPTQIKVRVYNLETGTHREYETTLRD